MYYLSHWLGKIGILNSGDPESGGPRGIRLIARTDVFLGLAFHNCRGLYMRRTYSYIWVLLADYQVFEGLTVIWDGADRGPRVHLRVRTLVVTDLFI